MQALLSPFRVYGRVGLHQQPTPFVFDLKQDSVRIRLKIISSGFYEKSVLHLSLENDHVQVDRLAVLPKCADIIVWAGEIVFLSGWRPQMIIS